MGCHALSADVEVEHEQSGAQKHKKVVGPGLSGVTDEEGSICDERPRYEGMGAPERVRGCCPNRCEGGKAQAHRHGPKGGHPAVRDCSPQVEKDEAEGLVVITHDRVSHAVKQRGHTGPYDIARLPPPSCQSSGAVSR